MANEKDGLNQEEIERLLQQSGSSPSEPPAGPGEAAKSSSGALDQSEIEALLKQTETKSGRAPASGEQPKSADTSAGNVADPPPGQGEVGELLNQASKLQQTTGPSVAAEKAPQDSLVGEGEIARDDMDFLFRQAEDALASIDADSKSETPPGVSAFRLEEFTGAPPCSENATLDLIRDVELDLKIELGRTHMYLEDVLKLRRGAVVPLDKLAGDPVDIFVNGRLIARGEVLVMNDNFCVRVAELITGTGVASSLS